jgi:hypothetical protein
VASAANVVVNIANLLTPQVTAQIGAPDLSQPPGLAVQFRYAFVVDQEGLKTLDVSDLERNQNIRASLRSSMPAANSTTLAM